MRKQDQLVALIQSLTQGEKKHFMQHCRASGSGKSYLKLYELLLRRSSYDTDELCRLLKKTKAGLANEKKYLQSNLVNSLLQYHSNHPQLVPLNKVAEARLLMERNLPEMAVTALKQGIKASIEDYQPIAWHAHGLMLTLYSDPFMSFNEGAEAAKMHLQAMQQLATHIQLATDFELLNEKVFNAYHHRRLDTTAIHKKETRELLTHRLLLSDYDSFQLQSYKYSLQSLLYARLGDVNANVEVNRKNIQLYERQDKIDAIGYWNSIANLTQAIIVKANAAEYAAWMEKLGSKYYRKLPLDAEYISKMLEQHKNIFNSGAYFRFLYMGHIPANGIKAFAVQLLKSYKTEKELVPAYHFVSLVYKAAACSLVVNEPGSTIQLVSRLLNETSENVNSGSLKYARMIFMMAHAQVGNSLLLPSLQQSFINFYSKAGAANSEEIKFVRTLDALAKTTTKRERRAWFESMNTYLFAKKRDMYVQRMLAGLPIKQWIQANAKTA